MIADHIEIIPNTVPAIIKAYTNDLISMETLFKKLAEVQDAA